MCGRLCPQERLCEGHCVVGKKGEPVAIGKLETFVTEWQLVHGKPPPAVAAPATGKSLAIIGSGRPASASPSALRGPAIASSSTTPGRWRAGCCTTASPTSSRTRPPSPTASERLRDLGVEFVLGVRIGEDVAFEELEREFDAVFVAAGAIEGVQLGLEHEDAPGVYEATEFLVRGNLPPEDLPEGLRQPLPQLRSVVVIGGGDTSMDCVRTAVRLGAEEVRLVYRRTEQEMQGREEERMHAHEEGVIFEFLTAPTDILVDDQGAFRALRCQRMELGEPDESGRARRCRSAAAASRSRPTRSCSPSATTSRTAGARSPPRSNVTPGAASPSIRERCARTAAASSPGVTT